MNEPRRPGIFAEAAISGDPRHCVYLMPQAGWCGQPGKYRAAKMADGRVICPGCDLGCDLTGMVLGGTIISVSNKAKTK